MRTNFTLVAASISATLTTMAFAGPPAVWENVVVANGTNEAPSVPGGIMVPNSMNNPVIDGNGNIAEVAGGPEPAQPPQGRVHR